MRIRLGGKNTPHNRIPRVAAACVALALVGTTLSHAGAADPSGVRTPARLTEPNRPLRAFVDPFGGNPSSIKPELVPSEIEVLQSADNGLIQVRLTAGSPPVWVRKSALHLAAIDGQTCMRCDWQPSAQPGEVGRGIAVSRCVPRSAQCP